MILELTANSSVCGLDTNEWKIIKTILFERNFCPNLTVEAASNVKCKMRFVDKYISMLQRTTFKFAKTYEYLFLNLLSHQSKCLTWFLFFFDVL